MLRKVYGNLLGVSWRHLQLPVTGPFPIQRYFSLVSSLRKSDVYEPNYLESLKPKYPQYESLNVQIKGYDFPVLESYQRFVHQVAEYMDIEVSDCYAMPPQHVTAKRLRPKSSAVDAEYRLTVYERNLQLEDVNAPIYPVFLRIIRAALPEGVELTIQENTEDLEERRYVPDRDLLELKAELGRIGGPIPKKK